MVNVSWPPIVEICCSSLASVRNAAAGGAHRIELCVDLLADGLTPDDRLLEEACAASPVPIHVLVRPRPGDFVYSTDEWGQMRRDILRVRRFPVQGMVIGALDEDGRVAADGLRSLIDLCEGMDLTFHRAFDFAADPFASIDLLVELGFDRVLTSGGQLTALEGLPLLNQLRQRADGRLVVMPGGGITATNCGAFFDAGFREIHLSARPRGQHSASVGSEPVADLEIVRGVVRRGFTHKPAPEQSDRGR